MAIQDKAELIKLYSKYSKVISEFFEINDNTLKAITGSTYRSFHRLEKNQADGMSKIFKSVASECYSNNPTSYIQRDAFLALLIKRSKGKLKIGVLMRLECLNF